MAFGVISVDMHFFPLRMYSYLFFLVVFMCELLSVRQFYLLAFICFERVFYSDMTVISFETLWRSFSVGEVIRRVIPANQKHLTLPHTIWGTREIITTEFADSFLYQNENFSDE